MKSEKHVLIQKISVNITTWGQGSLKMNSSISAMTDVNCGTSGQRANSRMDIHIPLRYMDVQTAADVNIKPAVCISMMWRKMPKRTKSGRSMNNGRNWKKNPMPISRANAGSWNARHVPFRQRDILETSRKTRTSGALTTARQIRYIKNSCYIPLAEI